MLHGNGVCVSGLHLYSSDLGPQSLEKSSDGPTFPGTSDQPSLPGPSCLSFLRASLSWDLRGQGFLSQEPNARDLWKGVCVAAGGVLTIQPTSTG